MRDTEQPDRQSQFVAVCGSRGSITLPADVRRRYHLDEPGAQVEVIGRWSFAGPDGRATFEWIEIDKQPAIRSRRVGGHTAFSDP